MFIKENTARNVLKNVSDGKVSGAAARKLAEELDRYANDIAKEADSVRKYLGRITLIEDDIIVAARKVNPNSRILEEGL